MRPALGVAGAVVTILVSCSFPEPSIVADDGGGAASSSSGTTSSTSSTSGSGGNGAPDAGGDGSACKGDPVCDCDGDKQKKKDPMCGGLDCYDRDEDAFSGQTAYVTKKPPADFDGDWNCDNTVEKQYPGNVDCSSVGSLVDCANTQGFSGAQAGCGETGAWVKCHANGALCETETMKTEIQGCR